MTNTFESLKATRGNKQKQIKKLKQLKNKKWNENFKSSRSARV